jgi:hypothetical protein
MKTRYETVRFIKRAWGAKKSIRFDVVENTMGGIIGHIDSVGGKGRFWRMWHCGGKTATLQADHESIAAFLKQLNGDGVD